MLDSTDERDHHLDVLQPHIVANFSDRRALHFEARPEAIGDVACRATEAKHRVFLVGLVFVVRHAHDHRFRRKRGGDGRNAFGKAVDEETNGIIVAGHLFVYGDARFFVESIVFE